MLLHAHESEDAMIIELPPRIGGFNETDVREEIIAPLLRHLGYRAQSSANIIR